MTHLKRNEVCEGSTIAGGGWDTSLAYFFYDSSGSANASTPQQFNCGDFAMYKLRLVVNAFLGAVFISAAPAFSQALGAITFDVTAFQTGTVYTSALGAVTYTNEPIATNTSVVIDWGDGSSATAKLLSLKNHVNNKGYTLTERGQYSYEETSHKYAKPGTYSVKATLKYWPAGVVTDSPMPFVGTASVVVYDASPVNQITLPGKIVNRGTSTTVKTVLGDNIPPGTAVRYWIDPKAGFGPPFDGLGQATQSVSAASKEGAYDVLIAKTATPGNYLLHAQTIGKIQSFLVTVK